MQRATCACATKRPRRPVAGVFEWIVYTFQPMEGQDRGLRSHRCDTTSSRSGANLRDRPLRLRRDANLGEEAGRQPFRPRQCPHAARGKAADLSRQHGISETTLYQWKAKYGGLQVSDAKRLKALEEENRRLKRLLAETMLDNAALKDIASGKF